MPIPETQIRHLDFDPVSPIKRYRKAGIAAAAVAVAAAATIGGINKANHHPNAQAVAQAKLNAAEMSSPEYQQVLGDVNGMVKTYAKNINELVVDQVGKSTHSTQGKSTAIKQTIDIPGPGGITNEYVFIAVGDGINNNGVVTVDPNTVTGLTIQSSTIDANDSSVQQDLFTAEKGHAQDGNGWLLTVQTDATFNPTYYATDPGKAIGPVEFMGIHELVDVSQIAGGVYFQATGGQPPVLKQVSD